MQNNCNRRVLILSCSTGEGHNRAAEAIAVNLAATGVDCEIRDVLSFKSEKASGYISGLYGAIISKSPLLFGFVYHFANFWNKLHLPSPIYRANSKYADKLRDYLEANDFDCVICTHLFAMQAMTAARYKFSITTKCYGVMTDYTVYPFMKDCIMDGYFVPNDAVAEMFVKRGFKRERLFATGIPIHPKFHLKTTKQEARRQLDIPDDKKVIVVTMGGANRNKIFKLCKKLAAVKTKDSIAIVLTGRNTRLKQVFDAKLKPNAKITALDFTEDIHLYFKAADVVISKAGGLSSTEIATLNVPLVQLKAINGLESENMRFFSKAGLALRANSASNAVSLAYKLLADESCANAMKHIQHSTFQTNAAETIAEIIVSDF